MMNLGQLRTTVRGGMQNILERRRYMKGIRYDYTQTGIQGAAVSALEAEVAAAHKTLHEKSGAGADFLGWVEWPATYDTDEYARLKQTAARIRENADALVVVGIGGSYLGTRAVLEALAHPFHNQISKEQRKAPEIYFLGHHISSSYTQKLLELLETKSVYVNVISKSGTTTEPALAFRLIRAFMERKYGKEGSKDRIVATTDKARGALRELAVQEGYETYVIPDDIGGRYSVFTPVGLLPLAAAGIDTDALLAGAKEGMEEYANPALSENTCYQYAAVRNLLHRNGKQVEILVNYEPGLHFLSEWWKQLYGESEGKDGKGIFPAALDFSTDLHSMGQYVQDGQRMLFETVIKLEEDLCPLPVPHDPDDRDQLNFLVGKSMDYVNTKAFEGTLLAHVDGGTPNGILRVETLNAFTYGKLLYFFMKACGISGYMLGVNPFDQPGVEAYKKNMFALLGKKGYEELKSQLEARIGG